MQLIIFLVAGVVFGIENRHLRSDDLISSYNKMMMLNEECIPLQGDVWICMEVMDTSLDKFYRMLYNKGKSIPEDVLGKIAFAVGRTSLLLQ